MSWTLVAASLPSHNTIGKAKAHSCGTYCLGTLDTIAGLQHRLQFHMYAESQAYEACFRQLFLGLSLRQHVYVICNWAMRADLWAQPGAASGCPWLQLHLLEGVHQQRSG